jgi:DNA repair photolyase
MALAPNLQGSCAKPRTMSGSRLDGERGRSPREAKRRTGRARARIPGGSARGGVAAVGNLRWRLAEEEQQDVLFDDETALGRHVGVGAFEGMEFLHVNARSIINSVPASSRMPFRYTINAYRGCSHACVYCFARPTHEYLGLGIGTDFERRIVVKVNAVERLRAELRSPKWRGEHIAMGTNTDPYQHAEGKYHLTMGILGILAEFRNPFSLLTKSTLVLRDLELLARAATRTSVRCNVSIGTLDREVWKRTEPGTPPPDRRLRVVRRLNEAGVACGVLVAPVLPGMSDSDDKIREVIDASLEAGAVSVSAVGLHLRDGVRQHFMGWLESERPDLLPLYRSRFRSGAYQSRTDQQRIARVLSTTTAGFPAARADGYDTRGVAVSAEERSSAGCPEAQAGSDRAAAPEARQAESAPGEDPRPSGGQLSLL